MSNLRLIAPAPNAENREKITAPQKPPSSKNAQGFVNFSTSTDNLEQPGGVA